MTYNNRLPLLLPQVYCLYMVSIEFLVPLALPGLRVSFSPRCLKTHMLCQKIF